MDRQQFQTYAAEGYNRIPVTRTVLADIETPVSTYNKLAGGPRSFLLESVQGGERWGRYSIVGLSARYWLSVFGHSVCVFDGERRTEESQWDDPLEFVEQFAARFKVPELPDLPPFSGGLVGFFGYDTVRYVEQKLSASCPPDELGLPDVQLLLAEELAVFDNLSGTLQLVVNTDPSQAQAYESAVARLDQLEACLSESGPPLQPISLGQLSTDALEATISHRAPESDFKASVSKIQEYVLAGDVMQVVPSQRMSIGFDRDPLTLYRALRNLNPSPYLYFLDMGGFHIIGSSPEILVRFEEGEVTVRPIAGTRPRGKTSDEDEALAAELLADPKEIAEHLMLIDLGRNDVGQIAQSGSVSLTEKMVIERYSHVMHIVSNVTGKAREGISAMAALRASLPAGTLRGAPKVRAMEIIDELEPVKRGVYGGAVGYLSWSGNMDTAIAIRTALVKDGQLIIQAGAGVVADSIPENEWEEVLNKSRAMLRALTMVSAKD